MLAALLLGTLSGPLTPENRADFQRMIEPSDVELAYLQIPWRNQFWPGVQEAKRLQRPILFWTMNGHPLGCT